jgi:hypothetical protein
MINVKNQLKILVLGCSSAGKSTFITSTLWPVLLKYQYVRVQEDIEVFFAGRLKSNYGLGKNKCAVVHYNSLLAFDSNSQNNELDIENEYVFNKILETSFDEVFYCYAPDAVLLDRIRDRTLVEPEIIGDKISKYPSDHIINSFSKISQRKVLLDIHSLLQSHQSNFSVVYSQKKTSMVIPISDFVRAPRSVFLQKVLSDEKCNIELLKREFHRYSALAAQCAEFLSMGSSINPVFPK